MAFGKPDTDDDSSSESSSSSSSDDESDTIGEDDPEAAKARLRAKIRAQAGSLLSSKTASSTGPPVSIRTSSASRASRSTTSSNVATGDPPARKSTSRNAPPPTPVGSVAVPPAPKDDDSLEPDDIKQKTGQQSEEIGAHNTGLVKEDSDASLHSSKRSVVRFEGREGSDANIDVDPLDFAATPALQNKGPPGMRGQLAAFKSGGEGDEEDGELIGDEEPVLEIKEDICPAGTRTGVILCLIFLACWAVVLPIAIVDRDKNPAVLPEPPPDELDGNTTTTAPPTAPPTVSPSLLFDFPEYTQAALEDPTSPQSMALEWLYSDPLVYTYSMQRQMQRYALATFYYATGGDEWTANANWLDIDENGKHECFWYSQVPVCNNQQEYIVMELNDNNLVGELPPELSMLTSLKELHLQENALQGSIPAIALTSLQNMTWLDLQHNEMTGAFPTELGLMTLMDFLWLNGTRAEDTPETPTATIPTELALLTHLQELHMSSNKLDGSVPSELALLSKLDWITLRENALSGQIPSELSLLPRLTWLDFAENDLVGEIPSEIGWLNQTLRILQLESNALSGRIPDSMNRLTSVEVVWLHDNLFTGIVPVGLCYFKRIGKVQSIWIDCEEVECSCACDCTAVDVDEDGSALDATTDLQREDLNSTNSNSTNSNSNNSTNSTNTGLQLEASNSTMRH